MAPMPFKKRRSRFSIQKTKKYFQCQYSKQVTEGKRDLSIKDFITALEKLSDLSTTIRGGLNNLVEIGAINEADDINDRMVTVFNVMERVSVFSMSQ